MQQLGRKSQYSAPLNILNDLSREEKVKYDIKIIFEMNKSVLVCCLFNLIYLAV